MDATRRCLAPDGASIFYRCSRPARPRGALVLLHGVASNSTRWWEYVAGTALRGEWALIRIDRRGQGESVWRKPAGLHTWSDDVARILHAEGFESGFVGGHCLGANIAVAFAGRYPAMAAGLVLVEPMPRPALAGAMRRAARARALLHLASGIARLANRLGLYRRRLAPLDLEALDKLTREAMARGRTQDGAFARYASPLLDLTTTPLGSYARDLLAVTAPVPAYESIEAPVLALISRRSTFTDPAKTRLELGKFPRATVVELDARHWIPSECPEEMRRAIDDWIMAR